MRALFDHPWWLLGFAAIGVFAIIAIIISLFFALGRRPQRMWADAIEPVNSRDFIRSLAALLNVPVRAGGRAVLLNNGDEYFTAIIRDIRDAQRSVHVMVYIWEDGSISNEIIGALVNRARAGIQVRVLLDGLGAMRGPHQDFERLRAVGARVATFRPPAFGQLLRFYRRNHRRAIVIDGRIAYTGGAAIADKWAGNARNPKEWRDTMVRVQGPPAEHLQSSFAEQWAYCAGEVLTGEDVFPADIDVAEDAHEISASHSTGNRNSTGNRDSTSNHYSTSHGDERSRLMSIGVNSSPASDEHPLRLFFFLSFLAARERLWITTPYFVPDSHLRKVVMRRARAGVDVRILMPNEHTDARPIRQASRSYYDSLLRAGVRIYEYQPTMMHTKGVVVDGAWSVVGSANMDIRSKELNEENVLGILDEEFGAEMERTFLSDIAHATEIDRIGWRRRGLGARVVERICVLFAEQY